MYIEEPRFSGWLFGSSAAAWIWLWPGCGWAMSGLNLSFMFSGSAGVNPAFTMIGLLLVLAWRNAGWYGLDRWVLPRIGTPWHQGELFDRQAADGGEVRTT